MANHGFPHGFGGPPQHGRPGFQREGYRSESSAASQQSNSPYWQPQPGAPQQPYGGPHVQQQPYPMPDIGSYAAQQQNYPGAAPYGQPFGAPPPPRMPGMNNNMNMPPPPPPPQPYDMSPSMYSTYRQQPSAVNTRARTEAGFTGAPVSGQMQAPMDRYLSVPPYAHDPGMGQPTAPPPMPAASVGMQPPGAPGAPPGAPPHGGTQSPLEQAIIRDAINTFNRFDVTNDGHLELSEFMDALRALHLAISYHDALEKFRITDKDQNGKVSKEEFIGVYLEEVRKRTAQQQPQF